MPSRLKQPLTGEGSSSLRLTHRPAAEKDFAFLYALHRAAMRSQVEETWGGWDEDWQRAYFRKRFVPSKLRILQLDGKDVGVFSVQVRVEELFLVELKVHPDYQRRGIGTAVLRALIRLGNSEGKPVALKVLRANRLGRALYERLGFVVTGQTETHNILAREPDR
jgi:ribosomal protein S18 acetylase RimI-like enzyme